MKANVKGTLRKPFLQLKWKIKRRAMIKDAYYSVKSIKEILLEKDRCYQELIFEERKQSRDESKIYKLEGRLECLNWLFSN